MGKKKRGALIGAAIAGAAGCLVYHHCRKRNEEDPFMTALELQRFKLQNRDDNESSATPTSKHRIYAANCQVSTDMEKTGRNNHCMVIGEPGSGKSRSILEPNLLQMDGSYVVIDCLGELRTKYQSDFENVGYETKVFDAAHMDQSDHYNPFEYLRTEQDIQTLIDCLMQNVPSELADANVSKKDAARKLLEVLVLYVQRFQKKSEQNMVILTTMLKPDSVSKEPGAFLEMLFKEVKDYDPKDPCMEKYHAFTALPAVMQREARTFVAQLLLPFQSPTLKNYMRDDDFELANLGKHKTVIFVEVPIGDNATNFLVSLFLTQAMDSLSNAENECRTYPVTFMLDEFANIGIIPDLQNKLNAMEETNLSCMMFIQATGQLKATYPEAHSQILKGCDAWVYLGGNELRTMQELVFMCPQHVGTNHCDHITAAPSLDDFKNLSRENCLIFLKGEKPICGFKYRQ